MRILGLDEAGRGSVIGPLVVGACLFDGEQSVLKKAGADDSKALSAKRRDAILVTLQSLATLRTITILPAQIDEGNVNDLEIAAFLAHVAHFKPDRVYLDAPVNPAGIPKLRERLIRASGVSDWVVEPKADSTYPVVGAASIAAKVERDRAIEGLGPEVGSGYPSDPYTRTHLLGLIKQEVPMPHYVRTRWATLDNLRQQSLFGGG